MVGESHVKKDHKGKRSERRRRKRKEDEKKTKTVYTGTTASSADEIGYRRRSAMDSIESTKREKTKIGTKQPRTNYGSTPRRGKETIVAKFVSKNDIGTNPRKRKRTCFGNSI